MLVRARAPLRLGLAGGGTDVSPYCDRFGGCVLNATLDRYAYAIIETHAHDAIRLVSRDQQVEIETPLTDHLELDGRLDLHKGVYNAIVREFNGGRPIALTLTTFCDAPAGSGLGSSSTLVVAMIKAFSELSNLGLDDYELAHLAYRIERLDCGLLGGRQDQYSATFGGFNFMEFSEHERAIVNPLRVKNWILCELEASLILFYTGASRESAQIINDQIHTMHLGSYDAMHAIKRDAVAMKECVLKGDFEGIVRSMKDGWESKKRLAPAVSNPMIDGIYEAAMGAGAKAGKVSGAGGGGFMMFYVAPESRMSVIRALSCFDGQVSNCHFTKNGAQGWKL